MPPFPPPDAPLEDLPGGDLFASRLWFDLTAREALPPGTQPAGAGAHGLWLALRRDGHALGSLTTPYSQGWAPLAVAGADWHAAGRALGRLWRGRPPGRLELLDPALPGLDAFLAGLRAAGLATLRFAHVGQWHETLPPGMGWDGYLAGRPSALRNTLRRKLARGSGTFAVEIIDGPGKALETAIEEFHAVRAASWKPEEPFPGFDAALMRATAPLGLLRLGVLRADGRALAAQYWLRDRGGRRALVPKLFHVETARAASPGTVLTALLLRRLIEEDRVEELDFGRGDDAYKRLWVSERRGRLGVVVADPRHPRGLLAIARHAAGRWRAALRGDAA